MQVPVSTTSLGCDLGLGFPSCTEQENALDYLHVSSFVQDEGDLGVRLHFTESCKIRPFCLPLQTVLTQP